MNIYQEALDSQSACNLSGLVRSLAKMTDAIWDEARANNQGTSYVNRHPVVVMFVAQMVYLATGDSLDVAAYMTAHAVCERLARM